MKDGSHMKCLYQHILDTLPEGGIDVCCHNIIRDKRDCKGCEVREEALWWKKEQKFRSETTGDVTDAS